MNENVGRGAAFALIAIPAAVVIFALAATAFAYWGIAAFLVPTIAAALYVRGAGAPLSRNGWGAFVGISAAAIVLGIVGGLGGAAWAQFSSVNGKGGLLGAPFLRTLGSQFSNIDTIISVLIAVAIGAIAIVGAIRGSRTRAAQQQATDVSASAPAAAPVSAAPPTPSAPPVAPNQPSPGVILNGKPIDPQK